MDWNVDVIEDEVEDVDVDVDVVVDVVVSVPALPPVCSLPLPGGHADCGRKNEPNGLPTSICFDRRRG